jgi:hypothetical protein
MASPDPFHAEEMTHRLSVEIFGHEMPCSNPLNPYYQQNFNPSASLLSTNSITNNIIHHNCMLILITTRKSLPLVLDKVRPYIR